MKCGLTHHKSQPSITRGLPFQNFRLSFHLWFAVAFVFFLFCWQEVLLINTVEKIKTVGSVDTEKSAKLFSSHLYRLSTLHPSSQSPHFWWWSPPLPAIHKPSLSQPLPRACHVRQAKTRDSSLSPWTVQNYLDLMLTLWASHSTCIFRPQNPNLLNLWKTLKVLLNYCQKKEKKIGIVKTEGT